MDDPAEAAERAAIVAEAMSWLGTPYHHEGDTKGIGVDCGMLLVRVFVDCGLCEPFDPRPYARHWHLHRGEERYLDFVHDRTRKVEHPGPGDVVVYKYGRVFSHGGIVVEWPRIIHAWSRARAVVLADVSLAGELASRERLCFSYWAPGGRWSGISDQEAPSDRRPPITDH
jgi:cell wall-associated NlpC family hydrolase